MDRIYFDHAATTPLDPAVLEAMMPYLTGHYGNASSVHAAGRQARFAVEESRENVAALIGAEPAEIIFTSGGTESNNAAIKGVLAARDGALITSRAEHEAVLSPAHRADALGREVRWLEVDRTGTIDLHDLEKALASGGSLVSLMYVNNEVGRINPVEEITGLCKSQQVPFHCDAVQAMGLMKVDVEEWGVDLLSASAHKFYGPKGVGFLYVRAGTPWQPWIEGGAQERKRRGGTENVAGIVGLATALELAHQTLDARVSQLEQLKKQLLERLDDSVKIPYTLNSLTGEQGAAHVVNIAFPHSEGVVLDGEMLLLNMDMEGIALSSGSACTSGTVQPSHVLKAMGLDEAAASTALRFSFGKSNTLEEVDRAVDALERVLGRMAR